MGFINGLFILLSVIFFCLIFLGLIKPSWFKMTSRLKAAGIFSLATIICFVITGLTISDEEKARQKAEQEKVIAKENFSDGKVDEKQPQSTVVSKEPIQQIQDVKQSKSLGLTPDEFRQKLNDEIIQTDARGLKPIQKFSAKDKSFQINDLSGLNMSLVGRLNDQGKITSLTYTIIPNGTVEDTAIIMLYVGLTAKIISPEIEAKKKTETIIHLMTEAAKGVNNEKNYHKEMVGDVEYSSTASPYIGLWASFSTEESK